ncbi:MAG: ABC transporter ATP-binding protein [Clostridiales bacterium]|nr:ABC transporter ATP-binding protein [Clostridiales bacterium]
MKALITATGLGKKFGDVYVIKDFNLVLHEKEIVVIMGQSGIGKSTLLNILGKLEPYDEGEIDYDESVFEGIGVPFPFVFQEMDTLLPWKTVKQNISLVNPKASDDLLKELIENVGLTDHQNKFPHELSGGMKQRVGIARALICASKVLLMDEPFGSLDKEMRLKLQDFLLKIQDKYELSIIFVTHDEEEAKRIGHRILTIK